MLRMFGAKLRAFGTDRTGVVAIEFSILAWPFFGVVFMIFNTMLVHYFRTSLDGAVQNLAMDLRSGGKFILMDAQARGANGAVLRDSAGNATVDVSILRSRLKDYLPAGMSADEVLIEVFTRRNCRQDATCWDDAYRDLPKAMRKTPTFDINPAKSFVGANGSSATGRAIQFGAAGDSQYLVVYYPMSPISAMFARKDEVILPPTKLAGSDPERRVFGLVSTAMWINDPSVGVF